MMTVLYYQLDQLPITSVRSCFLGNLIAQTFVWAKVFNDLLMTGSKESLLSGFLWFAMTYLRLLFILVVLHNWAELLTGTLNLFFFFFPLVAIYFTVRGFCMHVFVFFLCHLQQSSGIYSKLFHCWQFISCLWDKLFISIGLGFCYYADETQIYISLKLDIDSAVSAFEACLLDIKL